jgi:hypothetical protein
MGLSMVILIRTSGKISSWPYNSNKKRCRKQKPNKEEQTGVPVKPEILPQLMQIE